MNQRIFSLVSTFVSGMFYYLLIAIEGRVFTNMAKIFFLSGADVLKCTNRDPYGIEPRAAQQTLLQSERYFCDITPSV